MKQLIIECQKQLRKVKLRDILYVTYSDGSLTIYLQNGDKLLHCQPLKDIEVQLPEEFVKINRNVIVNSVFALGIQKNNKKVIMEDGREFAVARRQMTTLVKLFKLG